MSMFSKCIVEVNTKVVCAVAVRVSMHGAVIKCRPQKI